MHARILNVLALGAGLLLATSHADAQTFPTQTIRIVVPAGPGGPTDLLARLIAERLQSALGQSAVVENRGGAGGVIGARAVASSAPDGHTLLFGNTATLATIPAVSKSAGYDPTKAFAAVAKIMDAYHILVVTPDLPVKSAAELVAYAKANPGKLNFGAAGIGNLTHLSGELLKAKTGIDVVTVQYKSGAESVNAMVSGQVQMTINSAAGPLVKEGRLRALAVTSAARKPDYPDLPTMIEAGIPDYVVTSVFGLVAPAGTPKPIIAKLNDAINEGLRTEAFRAAIQRLGGQATPESPEQFQALIVDELRKWTEIGASANIKVD
jgi:tripartite-type tricarboxylate transporter receptor subunit TctC